MKSAIQRRLLKKEPIESKTREIIEGTPNREDVTIKLMIKSMPKRPPKNFQKVLAFSWNTQDKRASPPPIKSFVKRFPYKNHPTIDKGSMKIK